MVLTRFLALQPPNPATPRIVDGGIVTAAVAALALGQAVEFALIAELPKGAQRPALPDFARFGYAVDAETGDILRPGDGPLPMDRHLYAALRLRIPAAQGDELEALRESVLGTLAKVAANGWELQIGGGLTASSERVVAEVRARPQDLPMLPLAAAGGEVGVPDGTGVLIGVVDFGCDFAHPAFRRADGSTRLRFLWDQNAEPGPGEAGPGRTYRRGDIAAALATEATGDARAPFRRLGYRPHENLYVAVGTPDDAPVHGTHVLSVAAGRAVPPRPDKGDPGCPAGVAPGAEIAFVHLRPGALISDGDAADLLDGVCAIFDEAETTNIAAVVNLSLGANFGPHDGSTLLDRALDAVLERPRRAIVVAAGNGGAAKRHAGGILSAGQTVTLKWRFVAGDPTHNALRIFCPAPEGRLLLSCDVISPSGNVVLRAPPPGGRNVDIFDHAGRTFGSLYVGLAPAIGADPLQAIEVRASPSGGREEIWQIVLRLAASAPDELRWDAWIERDDRARSASGEDRTRETGSSFVAGDEEAARSLSAIACGMRTITVGASDETAAAGPAPTGFTALGPTRDGRYKPDVAAPGAAVIAARARGGRVIGLYRPLAGALSGTSVSAPHVAGVVALMLQVKPNATAEQIGDALRMTTQTPQGAPRAWDARLGFGVVDAAAAVARAMAP